MKSGIEACSELSTSIMRLVVFILTALSLCEYSRLSNASHFYGEEMFADVTSDSTQEIITIHWRCMWKSDRAPDNEYLSTCSSGSPCPSGPSTIDMSTSNCNAAGIDTVDGSASYDSWTGVATVLYYPIGSVPASGTLIGMSFSDYAWGLLNPNLMSGWAYFGGQLLVLTARRTDNGLFNNTPRSPVAAIVTLWPGCGGTSFTIPVVDPDGDPVQCRWSSSTAECQDCCYSTYASKSGGTALPFTLTSDCTVTYTGGTVASNYYYAICIQMEDFYPSNPTIRISSSSLQFIVEVAKNPCSTQVSPLITDPCSLSMVAIPQCTDSLIYVVPNAVVPSNYSNTVGSSVILNCAIGYAPSSGGSVNVTCVKFNSTNGVWVASTRCSCMD